MLKMPQKSPKLYSFYVALILGLFINIAFADSPYRFFDWNVTYGNIYPLGVRQQVRDCFFNNLSFWIECPFYQWNLFLQGILINGQFPGPDIYAVTNDNIYINVHNSLPEPFLLSWFVFLSLFHSLSLSLKVGMVLWRRKECFWEFNKTSHHSNDWRVLLSHSLLMDLWVSF